MHSHTCTVQWSRGDAAFTDRRCSRAHEWRFAALVDSLHHWPHEACWIAHSIRGEVRVGDGWRHA